MLQQTQVSRVTEKFRAFLKLFPNFESLAVAPAGEVIKAWSGLGYNRRALFLHQSAQMIMVEYGGRLPKDQQELTKLPGVGWNTAGAVLAYAYNLPAVFIETNIRRVLLHHFFQDKAGISDAQLLPLIEQTVDRKNPREWYWALMDYGTYLAATVENPNRRSRHYNKQSKFEGSRRQVRGKILKLLMDKPSVAISQLEQKIQDPRVAEVAHELAEEGFVVIVKNRVRLK